MAESRNVRAQARVFNPQCITNSGTAVLPLGSARADFLAFCEARQMMMARYANWLLRNPADKDINDEIDATTSVMQQMNAWEVGYGR
ncbi:MAG: hypothetical protein JWP29_1941 [Rhodoferax sp.]|nr:hypothetical protein [Rhodoferax sp.]